MRQTNNATGTQANASSKGNEEPEDDSDHEVREEQHDLQDVETYELEDGLEYNDADYGFMDDLVDEERKKQEDKGLEKQQDANSETLASRPAKKIKVCGLSLRCSGSTLIRNRLRLHPKRLNRRSRLPSLRQ
jgi:hypothetical protein